MPALSDLSHFEPVPVGTDRVAEAYRKRGPDQAADDCDRREIAQAHAGQARSEWDEGAADCDETADKDRQAAEVLEVVLEALAMLFDIGAARRSIASARPAPGCGRL